MRFLKQLGFSLVEVLVSVGLLGGAGLILMNQQDISTKTAKKLTIDQEVDAFIAEMNRAMADQRNCTKTLKGKKIGDAISSIKLGLMITDGNTASNLYGSTVPASYIDEPYFNGKLFSTFDPEAKVPVYGKTGFKIFSMKLKEMTNPVSNAKFMDAIEVELGANVPPLLDQRITRYIYILGDKDSSGLYNRCASESLGVIEQAMAQACKSMEAEYSPETGRCQLKNLPKVLMAESAAECGSVFVPKGTYNVEKIVRETYLCTHYYEKKRSPLTCRWFYSDYTVTCTCEPDVVACPCAYPPPRTCRRYVRAVCVPKFITAPLNLSRCERRQLDDLKTDKPLADVADSGSGGTVTPGGSSGSGGSSGGTDGCFVAGTKVTLDGGGLKNIEDVVPGDRLDDGSGGAVSVLKLLSYHFRGRLYGINGGRAFFTPNHPFLTLGGWKSLDPEKSALESGIKVGLLREGDILVRKNGGLEPVYSLDFQEGEETVYNFNVSGNHQYVADDYVVHNLVKLPPNNQEQAVQ